MHGLTQLDNNFILPDNFDLEYLTNLPVQKHTYGNTIEEMPTSLYWMEYQLGRKGEGSISFARRVYLEYPQLADHVVDYLSNLLPNTEIFMERVNILKTVGNVLRHVDESKRKCCINIGLKNSSNAITYSSNTTNHLEFDSVKVGTVCKDNHAYLLDTASLHEVIGINDLSEPRFLITYGFGRDYSAVKSLCRVTEFQ